MKSMIPRLRFAVALATGLVVTACTSPAPHRLQGRVTEFGLYNRGTETVRPDASAPSGQSRGSRGYKLLQATHEIPLAIGTSFGFCYEIAGFETGATPRVAIETSHPAFARPGSQPVDHGTFSRKLVPRQGVVSDCTGYGFDHDFELVPGTWRFIVVVDGNPVLTEEFNAK
jgi:hypothetical protein